MAACEGLAGCRWYEVINGIIGRGLHLQKEGWGHKTSSFFTKVSRNYIYYNLPKIIQNTEKYT